MRVPDNTVHRVKEKKCVIMRRAFHFGNVGKLSSSRTPGTKWARLVLQMAVTYRADEPDDEKPFCAQPAASL